MKNVHVTISVTGGSPFEAKGKDRKTSTLALKNAMEHIDNTLETDEVSFQAYGEADNGEARAIRTTNVDDAISWLKENE